MLTRALKLPRLLRYLKDSGYSGMANRRKYRWTTAMNCADNPYIESFNGSFRDKCVNAPLVPVTGGCEGENRSVAGGIQYVQAADPTPEMFIAKSGHYVIFIPTNYEAIPRK
jgi:hypothetical protein